MNIETRKRNRSKRTGYSWTLDSEDPISSEHLSQYLSSIVAPSVLYVTNFVAGSPQPIQYLILFLGSDVKGSILFSIFQTIISSLIDVKDTL